MAGSISIVVSPHCPSIANPHHIQTRLSTSVRARQQFNGVARYCFLKQSTKDRARTCLDIKQFARATRIDAASMSSEIANTIFSENAIAKIVAIVGYEAPSPLGQATWEEVLRHTAQRLKWVDNGYELIVINDKTLISESFWEQCRKEIISADIWVVVGVHDSSAVNFIISHAPNIQNIVSFESSSKLKTTLKGKFVQPKDPLTRIEAALPGSDMKELLDLVNLMEEAWLRKNSDDVRFVMLILIDKFVSPVESLKSLRATDLDTLKCMIKNCGPQILACLSNPNCRKALTCLNKCAPTDQVCSYQCIVTYECPELEAFSLCVLQKHNCLRLNSKIPEQPVVQPMVAFRGEPLSYEVAEDIFIGWLGKIQWSWRVAAGQNAAYDQFPCQFQIFYRGKARGSMWYDPVFQVRKLDGSLIWRRRHYRVVRGPKPGTFYFSVLDNGVVSKEFWRIIDATDDLKWALFFYSGAAAAAGQAYTGAVLVTPDGQWPDHTEHARLITALEKCGIKEWEMYRVNNKACQGPPLGLPKDVGIQCSSLMS